jgi:hypothetical protein
VTAGGWAGPAAAIPVEVIEHHKQHTEINEASSNLERLFATFLTSRSIQSLYYCQFDIYIEASAARFGPVSRCSRIFRTKILDSLRHNLALLIQCSAAWMTRQKGLHDIQGILILSRRALGVALHRYIANGDIFVDKVALSCRAVWKLRADFYTKGQGGIMLGQSIRQVALAEQRAGQLGMAVSEVSQPCEIAGIGSGKAVPYIQ